MIIGKSIIILKFHTEIVKKKHICHKWHPGGFKKPEVEALWDHSAHRF